MARVVWQLVGVLLLVGVVGAYFWPIALTLAAAYLTYLLVLNAALSTDDEGGGE
jgi:hypothetical protein